MGVSWPLASGRWPLADPIAGGAPPAGSPAYAAPENFIEGATVTFSADVWSLVITLFELVTGELPYKTMPDAISASAIIAVMPRTHSGDRALIETPASRNNGANQEWP